MARTDDISLSVLLDEDDDVQTLSTVRRLHARPRGVIVCEPPPMGGASALAREMLAALGKDPTLRPASSSPLWPRVTDHLSAEKIRHVVLLRAHTQSYDALRHTVDATDLVGAPLAHLRRATPHAERRTPHRRTRGAAGNDQ